MNSSEWDLLNWKLNSEIGTTDQYLDQSTKWLYADQKGTQVFALYGIGDGTDPTPLYASGGKKAAADYNAFLKHQKGELNGAYGNRTALNRILRDIESR